MKSKKIKPNLIMRLSARLRRLVKCVEAKNRQMMSQKLILRLLTVFILAGISSGKRCYAPVFCDNGKYTETTWIEVSPPCRSETNQLNSELFDTSGQKGEKGAKGETGVIAESNVTMLKKEIETQKTTNDVVNDIIYDQQLVIKSLNGSVESTKEENKKEKSERAKVKAKIEELKAESVKINGTIAKQMSEFEEKLNKLQKTAIKNKNDILAVQTANSNDLEDSVTIPLIKKKNTQPDIATTSSGGCEGGDVYYGGYCFWFDATYRTFTAQELACRSRNSTVGYILDSTHYNTMINKLHAAAVSSGIYRVFWLGLKMDLSTGNVTIIHNGLKAPFVKLMYGEPDRKPSDTNIFLQVDTVVTSIYNGMGDIGPGQKYGVICQHKNL